jgi:putative redox protein
MQATARRTEGFAHDVSIRDHSLRADLRVASGGTDSGPGPEELLAGSLASCTAMTIELYAGRKGWELGAVEVQVTYEAGARGEPTEFAVVLRLGAPLSDEQVKRLGLAAASCPVHRILEGQARFSQTIERAPLSA